MNTLLAASISIISSNMTESQQYTALRPYINPPPGENIYVELPNPNASILKRQLEIDGIIEFTPPKGSCFFVKKNSHEKATQICEKRVLRYKLADLDEKGRLKWYISTHKNDHEKPYIWYSDHRFATVIEVGSEKKKKIPIHSCHAGNDKIRLKLFDSKEWVITFPRSHSYVDPQPEFAPLENVGYDSTRKRKTRKSKRYKIWKKPKNFSSTDIPPYKKYSEHPNPLIAQWQKPSWKTRAMSGEAFRIHKLPSGRGGKCRYQLVDKINTGENGWIECRDIELFDSISIPLTCGKDFVRKRKAFVEKSRFKSRNIGH